MVERFCVVDALLLRWARGMFNGSGSKLLSCEKHSMKKTNLCSMEVSRRLIDCKLVELK